MKMEFGVWLKQQREALGYSTRELSEKIGKSSSYISALERGTTKLPSPSVAKDLFYVLRVEDIEEQMVFWGIIEDNEKLMSLLGMEKDLDVNHLKKDLISEIENMVPEHLDALNALLKRHRDVLINFYVLEQTGNRQAINGLKDYMDFLVGRYGKSE
jgi:transcriptional regulator with XRE-family HTH domain